MEKRIDMTQTQKKEYTARVAQANRSELVVIIYELFFIAMDEAEQAFKKGKLEEGVKEIKRAEGFLQELMGSLDKRYEVAQNLMNLYRYVYEQLIFSVIRRKMVHADTVREVMGKLKDRSRKRRRFGTGYGKYTTALCRINIWKRCIK